MCGLRCPSPYLCPYLSPYLNYGQRVEYCARWSRSLRRCRPSVRASAAAAIFWPTLFPCFFLRGYLMRWAAIHYARLLNVCVLMQVCFAPPFKRFRPSLRTNRARRIYRKRAPGVVCDFDFGTPPTAPPPIHQPAACILIKKNKKKICYQ